MHPLYNSVPYHSNEIQRDGTTASAAQQVMPTGSFQPNPSNLPQIQSQMGSIVTPQISVPLNSFNTHLCNRPISTASSSCFMNVPNQPFPLQNAMHHPLGQFHNGFIPQNLGSIAMNQMNSSQPSGQFFAHNSINLPPFHNQNFSLQNGQLCLRNPFQNMSQFVQMQMPNYTQVVPGNVSLFQNQVAQGMGPQNPNFLVNQQFGKAHPNGQNPNFLVNQQFGTAHPNGPAQHGNQELQKLSSPIMDVKSSKQSPNSGQQLLRNSSLQLGFGSVQPQQAQNFRPPNFTKSQGNPGQNNGVNNANTKWKTSQSRNFTRHKKNEASQMRFKSHSHHAKNAKGKFRFHDEHGGKGYNNDWAANSGLANSTNRTLVEKKSLPLNYSEQEIQQWREDRKKNYPSKVNTEKNLTEKQTLPEVADRDAKLRRQQLKEILAKQAELGCEVAEIPSFYLSDSEKQGHGNKKEWGKKGRFQNKFNKRGRLHQNDRFSKKRRSGDHDSSRVNDENSGFIKKQRFVSNVSSTRPTINKKEPTLLQKLLSADLKRDKSHLLQVFRFMGVNSFFKNWPEKSLRFPSVIVKETGGDGEEKASVVENAVRNGGEKTVKVCNCDGENGDDKEDNDETNAQHKGGIFGRAECSGKEEVEGPEEEEGEIID